MAARMSAMVVSTTSNDGPLPALPRHPASARASTASPAARRMRPAPVMIALIGKDSSLVSRPHRLVATHPVAAPGPARRRTTPRPAFVRDLTGARRPRQHPFPALDTPMGPRVPSARHGPRERFAGLRAAHGAEAGFAIPSPNGEPEP